MKFFIIVIFVLMGVYLSLAFLKRLNRWMLFGKREEIGIENLHDLFPKNTLDLVEFKTILELVASAFKLSVGQLRPDDSFKKNLSAIDSFELGHCNEALEVELRRQYSLEISKEPIITLRDLVRRISLESETEQVG